MKDAKDFDVRQFAPESSATVMTVSGSDVRPNRRSLSTERSLSSEQSELTGRNDASGQPERTPPSETIEETAPTEASEQTRPIGEIAPLPPSKQTVGPRQTASTSANEQSVSGCQTALAQSSEPIQQIESPQPTQSTPIPPSRVSSRQRRASLDEYRETFLAIPKIADRQPVFVSRDIRDKIDGVVRRLGERRMSVSGFLENLARHHLDLYADDLEQWKRL